MFTSVTLHSKANVDNYQHVVARTKRSYLVTKKSSSKFLVLTTPKVKFEVLISKEKKHFVIFRQKAI